MSGAMTTADKQERAQIQKIIARKVYKREFLTYKEMLSSRGLTVKDACETQFEQIYMQLWFSLNQQTRKKGKNRNE